MTTWTSDFFLNGWRCSSPGEMTKPFQQLKLTTNRWPSCWRRMKFPRNGGEQAIQTGLCFQQQVSNSFEWADVSNNRLQSHSNSWQRACKQKAVRVLFWREVTFIGSQMQFNRINNKECQSYLTGQWCCEMRMWQGQLCAF